MKSEATKLKEKEYYKQYCRTKKGLLMTMYNQQKHSSKVRSMPPPNYTYKELSSKFWNTKLDCLHKQWEDSGYCKELRPSLDRPDVDRFLEEQE